MTRVDFLSNLWSTVIIAVASGVWKWSGVEGGARGLASGEHERHKGRCGLFLLSLIGQDPLSLTFCTASLSFHMVMTARPEEETRRSWVEEDKDSLSLSLPPFHAYISTFLASSPLNILTDFGMKGNECLADGKGEDGAFATTRTTCEDQVHCNDPQPCVRGVLFLSGPCTARCRSVIVWAVLPVIAQAELVEERCVAFQWSRSSCAGSGFLSSASTIFSQPVEQCLCRVKGY